MVQENDEEYYFEYSASLRIFGNIENPNEITNLLGLEPKSIHKIGGKIIHNNKPYDKTIWIYQIDIPEDDPLELHINALWNKIKNKKKELLKLKEKYTVDVFLGYRSNCCTAGIEFSYKCLDMFTELEIPFGVSIIIA
ncbi:MAG: DUF4279 domain-containing protein [Treponema sp.]|jgi:hypothetical protein|nr:DUF4279 domain-containing protein [Treponema sp.]